MYRFILTNWVICQWCTGNCNYLCAGCVDNETNAAGDTFRDIAADRRRVSRIAAPVPAGALLPAHVPS